MTARTSVDSLYAIQDESTGKYIAFGSKVAWVSVGAAKNAFNLHMKTKYSEKFGNKEAPWQPIEKLFDKQTDYAIVEFNRYCGGIAE